MDGVFDEVLAGLAGCDASETLALAARLARLTARLEGLTVHTHVHLARQRPPNPAAGEAGEPYSSVAADELAAELGQSPRTMSSRLATAWDIAHDLPVALADLAAGLLDHTRLAALHGLTVCLTARQRAFVEATMLAGSRLASPPQWRRKIHRLVARLDPDAAAKRRRRAHTERRVAIDALDDGMACLTAVLSAEDSQAIYDRINQIARTDARTDGDSRSIDARRADVLAALLLGNRREHVTVELQVIACVGTLASLDENPAELVGYGPIPASVGRALAADAHWRRVLTDPETGTVLDLGHRRVPTPALARLVRHQQTRCVFPGCGMPATHADLDHTVAHTHGGRTALDNLGLLCRRHHRAKHRRDGWRLDQLQPGVFTWTSPTGRTYRVDSTSDEEGGRPADNTHSRPTSNSAFG
ncbi:HNH endonuclease [Pseudofrankia inefficax]|uniref:HNH endonuclease n=1 Tax=Pseudofrankia inefficax (strain DSM 45817 / CECT 9037 / DDB 130130 / EuI1c) TaxID=298654 RepID=E3JBR3_PSEI1|nr:HNH endonuclease [Pseudofrankia inefficax]